MRKRNRECLFWCISEHEHLCLHEKKHLHVYAYMRLRADYNNKRGWIWEWDGIILVWIRQNLQYNYREKKTQKRGWCLTPSCWNHRLPSLILLCKLHDVMTLSKYALNEIRLKKVVSFVRWSWLAVCLCLTSFHAVTRLCWNGNALRGLLRVDWWLNGPGSGGNVNHLQPVSSWYVTVKNSDFLY